MKQLFKCEYCDKPVNSNNTVFIKITRYDKFGRRVKRKVYCTTCWDHVKIFFAYADHDEKAYEICHADGARLGYEKGLKDARPKGEWIMNEQHNTVCSICGGIRRDNRFDYIDFCNKCGADMRGDV